ncbi:maleylpyruvate isomerase family mycothiol-dependent enzyme [Phycicoccus ginsengisoli]
MESDLAALAAHTDRLLATASSLDDPGAASLCDGWTRGHVLTHVARNAEAIDRLAQWALDGTRREMYPGGTRARDAEIEAGAARSVPELVADVRTTADALTPVLDRLATAPRAVDHVEMRGGLAVSPDVLPTLRLREVVFHHVDLAAGFGFADVEPELTRRFVADGVARLGAAAPGLALSLRSDEGDTWLLGPDGADRAEVSGPLGGLLLWLARRDPSGVRSDRLPELPRGS